MRGYLLRSSSAVRRGFSLLEVLLATFILGIGLIMVASIFPVAASWTMQSTQNSVSQTVALNAIALIQQKYGPSSADSHKGSLSTITSTATLVPLPQFVGAGVSGISICERCYQFGNPLPFPASNPERCYYFWTALCRANPANAAGIPSHDIYVFVFRKGDLSQQYLTNMNNMAATDTTNYAPGLNDPTNSFSQVYAEIPGVRDSPSAPSTNFPATFKWYNEPTLVTAPWGQGKYYAAQDPSMRDAVPPIGSFGVGLTTGTVFRQTFVLSPTNITNSVAVTVPAIKTGETVVFSPPADGTSVSPLVYVYQTTVPF